MSQYGFPALVSEASDFSGTVILSSGQRHVLSFRKSEDGAIISDFSAFLVSSTFQVLVRHATMGLLPLGGPAFSSVTPGMFTVSGPTISSENASLVS